MKILILSILVLTFSASSFSASKKNKNSRRYHTKRTQSKKNTAKVLLQESSYIDDTQRFISNFWSGLNYNMDSFFSDQKYSRKENNAKILAYLDIYKKEGEDLKKYFDVRIKVDLPKLSRRLSVTIEKERDDILESRSNQITNGQSTKDSDYAASLNYANISDIANTELNTGFRFAIPLDPFIKYRVYKEVKISWMDIHFEQKFIFFRQEHFSEYTQMSFSKRINDNLTISQNNSLSWSDSDDLFVLRNSLNLGQRISDKKWLSYSIGVNAQFIPVFTYIKYDAGITYRQILYKSWLFGSAGFGADFLKLTNWNMTNFAVIRAEILFQ
jgi:hypothetical protein